MGTQRASSGSKGQHVDFLDIGHVDIHHGADIYPDVDISSAVDILSAYVNWFCKIFGYIQHKVDIIQQISINTHFFYSDVFLRWGLI